MAVFRPAETPGEELQRRGSVMAPPKSTAQALVDFFFGSTPAERLANFGTMGFGAIVPTKTVGSQAAVRQIEQAFSPIARKALNLIGSRGRTKGGIGTFGQSIQPLMDVPLFTGKSHLEAVQAAEEAGIPAMKEWFGRYNIDPSSLLGSFNPATASGQAKGISPWIGASEASLERGVPVHEATHVLESRLRPSTMNVLEQSFKRRFNELAAEASEKGEMTPVVTKYLNQLYSNDPKDVSEAVSEILGRLMQGVFTPSGPERHLLSPVGRALAEARFPRLPDLPGP